MFPQTVFLFWEHDTRVAERGATLFLEGYAPLIMMSGGLGRLTKELWTEPEARRFATIAKEMGVPEEAILVEDQSTNTGENIIFSNRLLNEHKVQVRSYIVVQKPYMERRTFATFKRHLPDTKFCVTSPQLTLGDYISDELPMEKVVNIMVGDLQRIRLYPEKGFQIHQEIPDKVWQAYEELVAMGYDQQLIK